MILHDAHNHLQDDRLRPVFDEVIVEMNHSTFGHAVVNGTRESDWTRVTHLSKLSPQIIPSFGIHPWYVQELTEGWDRELEERLESSPNAAVGEIGLDRWVKDHDLALQVPIFLKQIALAQQFDRPVTIHCVRAWGALYETIRSADLPSHGFLLHAYGGPAEMVKGFVDLGAYFSFSAYFLHDRKSAQRSLFSKLPLGRVLVETDAPDMAPPRDLSHHPLFDSQGEFLNHPSNIHLAYEALARLRGMRLEELAGEVGKNFERLFGPHP